MSAESTLRLAVESLAELGIPYMVTGSLASAFYGEPRSTQDVDVVVPAVDPATGWKIDFIVLKDTAFGQAAFEGRSVSELGGVPLHVIRAEDIVVAKLEWAKLGASERQIRDVVGVLLVQGSDLDRRYIARWVTQLGLRAEWDRALALERQNEESV